MVNFCPMCVALINTMLDSIIGVAGNVEYTNIGLAGKQKNAVFFSGWGISC
jgi:hypothetical protein